MWQKQNSHENWKDGSDELLQREIDVCRRGLFFYKIKIEDLQEQINNNQEETDSKTNQTMEVVKNE